MSVCAVERCGRSLAMGQPNQRFCSGACRQFAYRVRLGTATKAPLRDQCVECSGPIYRSPSDPNSPLRKYCDDNCKAAAYRRLHTRQEIP